MSAPVADPSARTAAPTIDMPAVGAYEPPAGDGPPIRVRRWPTERPLLAAVAVAAGLVWVALAVSLVGLVYAPLIAGVLFVGHVAFVAHLRGSAVRVGPDQLPALHARVAALARHVGLRRTPEVYVLQAGGALNALATRFLGAEVVVLYAELLDACGDDEAARDMIIAHELGHLHAGHLRWQWLLLPGTFVPFLGAALSRAREYTADRYGLAGAGTPAGAVRGLAVLAAGPALAPRLDLAAFVRQHRALDTGWMRIGEWMGGHPPLARRVARLDPALGTAPQGGAATVRALAIVAAAWMVPAALVAGAAALLPAGVRDAMRTAAVAPTARAVPFDGARVAPDFARLAAVVDAERDAGRPVPADARALAAAWARLHPAEPLPGDPADGSPYGYTADGGAYRLVSRGPDALAGTPDDLTYDGGDPRP